MLALQVRQLPNDGIHLVLEHPDNFLSACTDPFLYYSLPTALTAHFNGDWQPHTYWYLQRLVSPGMDTAR